MCQPRKQFNKCHRSALGRHDGLSKCFQGWRETHLCSDEAVDCYLADQSLTDVTRRDVIHHTHRSSCRSSLTSFCPQTLMLKSLKSQYAVYQSNNTGDLHHEICAARFQFYHEVQHERNETDRKKVYPEVHNNSNVTPWDEIFIVWRDGADDRKIDTWWATDSQDRSAENRLCIHDEDVGVWSEPCVWIHDTDEWS